MLKSRKSPEKPKSPVIRKRFDIVDYASRKKESSYKRIDLALGHSPLGYPKEIDSALKKATPEDLINYPTPYPETDLSPMVKERFNLPKETRVFFNGDGSYGLLASMLNDLVSKKQIQRGVRIIGYGPQFTNVALLADRAEIPYDAVQPSLELDLADKLGSLVEHREKNRKPAIVYVDNPNNPTGDFATLNKLIPLAEITKKRKDLLIVDEAYGDFTEDSETAMRLIKKYPHLIVLRSVSKGVGLASPRLGYAVTSPEIGHVYENVQLVFAVDGLTLLLAQVALNPKILEGFLREVRDKTNYVKTYFIKKLKMLGISVYPTDNDVSIFMAKGPNKFFEKLYSVGIDVENLHTFDRTYKGLDSSYVRFRVPATIKEVNEAISRIATIK